MPSNERIRRLVTLAPWTALLLAIGCGGGDKGPSGPGGGQGPVSSELVSLGRMGLPADAQLEDCTLTRFYGGGLEVTDDGSWQITLQVHDNNYGDWGYADEGEIEEDGTTVWFVSDVSGSSYQGEVDGSEVRIMYDWCYNGVPDVQLVFDR
jgi:hypothetical protein